MLDTEFRTQTISDVYTYWQSKNTAGKLPSRQDIEPSEMIAFLPNLILLDVQQDPMDFRYRLIGTTVVAHLHKDLTNRWMSSIEHQKPPSIIWSNCQKVTETGEPFYPNTPYIGPKKEIVDVEDLVLPLAKNGRDVDMLLIAVAYVKKSHIR